MEGFTVMDRDGEQAQLEDSVLIAFWMRHYQGGGLYTLCGNTGLLALHQGLGEDYCVCPNGRTLRRIKA